jgi:hypothetical protein
MQPQALLFARSEAQGDVMPSELKREVVSVLAELLVEAAGVARVAKEERNDEREGQR